MFLSPQAKVCGLFKKNLAEDKTELLFDKTELEGCADAWIAERTRDGKVVVTLKYPAAWKSKFCSMAFRLTKVT